MNDFSASNMPSGCQKADLAPRIFQTKSVYWKNEMFKNNPSVLLLKYSYDRRNNLAELLSGS